MLASCLKRRPSNSPFCKGRKRFPQTTRSVSSKCNSSPGKSVTFADCYGKRLVYVKLIYPSSFEQNVFPLSRNDGRKQQSSNDESSNDKTNCEDPGTLHEPGKSRPRALNSIKGNVNCSVKFLSRYLPQPIFRADFFQRYDKNSVCLENIFVSSCTSNVLIGVIRVKNIAYEKAIFVRYTLNHWKDFREEKAEFSFQCSDGTADKFLFRLHVPPMARQGQEKGLVEFAICYKTNSLVFWDNNYGSNYKAEFFKRL